MVWNEQDRAARPTAEARKEWYDRLKAEDEVLKEARKGVCSYCVGTCVHEVDGAEEAGLRFVQSQILDAGVVVVAGFGTRYDLTPDTAWTRFPERTRQPKELAVYTIAANGVRDVEGPRGGQSASTKSRVGATVKRSGAGQVLARIIAAGLDPMRMSKAEIARFA